MFWVRFGHIYDHTRWQNDIIKVKDNTYIENNIWWNVYILDMINDYISTLRCSITCSGHMFGIYLGVFSAWTPYSICLFMVIVDYNTTLWHELWFFPSFSKWCYIMTTIIRMFKLFIEDYHLYCIWMVNAILLRYLHTII